MSDSQSPFPGMDPYLEDYWRDVHQRLCTYSCDAIQAQIRPQLIARLEERLLVESEIDDPRSIYPDVKIVERHPWRRSSRENAQSGVAVADPLLIKGEAEPAFEGFIQIIDPTTGNKLITVIEFLSHSNKLPGDGQQLYKQKQAELREAKVSLVEIDLLRCGSYVVEARRDRVPTSHYRVSVHRGWRGEEHEYYPIDLPQRLPQIRIPLRDYDDDAQLDLQALIDKTYLNGAYDQIDYSKPPPEPALDRETAAWVDQLLRKTGKR